ncbi:NAD-dependent succinate-semialdehyde dehydrogenase [Agrobacterium rosae]|uniref:NAD-dependent succinate-semialdehyde dehydrogenase n=1 Tax=Agrobacterium rosae TaxID=1972867 RepID=A0AAE5S0G5_9HYPH|nr:NAD-dependent succinate-semialdehyde dehydrogenase [Agrobacterium rosae]KAA3512929.1 NAD-dependent succinate-semialdehyde dehydrogenase [Agrobacterium rosae]KAA3521584.1 NAD-dependent succinate-semialdehyde dehydrogenase [Agrobacterium rosae]MCM2432537.1 NAD-dependent succinate-semialdehyde dehydrogenase [Agrobacterium rosae]MDX8328392.1 NAD-dependent succinate-semialdehyde dehydrogenase [Agrobacterium rosae]MQB48509.1 NAD-dependent succinate-semialdehyde dehydrogenase [Agrobacterium rosae]
MHSYPNVKLLINGEWRDALSGKTIAVSDPATDEILGQIAHAEKADLDLALDAADKGFKVWRETSAYERSKIMRKAADLLRERKDTIAWLMTREQGKPLAQSAMEVMGAADTIDWFAEEARRTYGQVIPARATGVSQLAIKVPVGPVAAFTPWNFPINQIVRKLSAALAAGCSIIVKAPEETPASPAELIRAFVDAGVPAGVVNLVYGVPSEISEYLIPHPVIRKISFTGSTPIGKHLAALAGKHMKRATMELGGHAPVMIFDDANIEKAVEIMAMSKFRNAGQVCVAPTRFLVQEGVASQFLDGFVKAAEAVKVGNGLEDGITMGPLANERRIPAMEALIQDAVSNGAELKTGGKRIGNKGNFFEPTVLANVPTSAKIMNDEPFGPVAIVNTFKSFDDAISEANRLPFGLASFAFTGSVKTAHELGRQVEAGMLTINHNGLALPEVPFGGIKDSGYGTEGGSEAVGAYLETRFVSQMN